MKSLLTITAFIEGATGLALATVPALVFSALFGISLTGPSVILISRIAGGTLIAIAIACWLSKNGTQSALMVKLMAGYNIFSIVLLVYIVLVKGMNGPGLWPAVILHLVLLIWCLISLQKRVREFN